MRALSIGFGILAAALSIAAPSTYEESVRAWQRHRNDGLRKPDSWLTLAGLFWLKPGDNTIGSAETNNFVLPKDAPAHMGKLRLEGDKVTLDAPGKAAKVLSYDEFKPDIVKGGSVSYYVIKRGDRFGVRGKDSASPVLKGFRGVEFFPINPAFHFQAKFVSEPRKVPILNVLGETEMQESPGVVEFEYQRHLYKLRPVFEEADNHTKTLFFLFKDQTNKSNTYQAGRMLNTKLPVNGVVDVDFNRSYNPPCTFTPYATCPLPPRENALPFAVEAGEKRYGSGHADYALR